MTPNQNDRITIYFRNNLQLEGIVISWSDQESVLESITGTSTIVIQKTADDVLAYKISNAQPKYEKLKEKTIKTEDDIKEIAQLKIELNEIERQEIQERLNAHTANNIREVNYGIPNITTIPSTKQLTNKEARSQSVEFGTELSKMFR